MKKLDGVKITDPCYLSNQNNGVLLDMPRDVEQATGNMIGAENINLSTQILFENINLCKIIHMWKEDSCFLMPNAF